MKIEELHDEEMYALFAPDGSIQPMTLAPDFATCVGVIRVLHKAGMCKSFHDLCRMSGFKIMPVKISVIQNGDENKAFKQQEETDNG